VLDDVVSVLVDTSGEVVLDKVTSVSVFTAGVVELSVVEEVSTEVELVVTSVAESSSAFTVGAKSVAVVVESVTGSVVYDGTG